MAQQPHFNLSVVAPPAAEPITYAQAKKWLRVDFDDDQDVIASLITAAREQTEEYTGRCWINRTLKMQSDRFPLVANLQYAPGAPGMIAPVLQNVWPLDPSIWAIMLLRCPASGVSIQYYDNNGTLQTMDPATVITDFASEPPRLSPASGSYWPSAQWRPNAVSVQFTAGYGTDYTSVPERARLAMRMQIGIWYDSRNGADTGLSPAVVALLDQLRVQGVW